MESENIEINRDLTQVVLTAAMKNQIMKELEEPDST
jgi:hypothetical protein